MIDLPEIGFDTVSMVKVKRLHEAVDPFYVLGIPEPDFDWRLIKPLAEFDGGYRCDKRTTDYHLGRVRYFMDQFTAHAEVDPVEIDAKWNRYSPESLDLIDGHHRLCGAILAGVDVMPANVGGPVEMINWLNGLTDKKPE